MQGWDMLVQWKDGSTTWESLIDVKERYPVQVAEYSRQLKLYDKPEFAWWVSHFLKKRKSIIAKIKSE